MTVSDVICITVCVLIDSLHGHTEKAYQIPKKKQQDI